MVQIVTKRIIGKGKYDKKFHILDSRNGVTRRICDWRIPQYGIIIGKEITCQNCLIRQNDEERQVT